MKIIEYALYAKNHCRYVFNPYTHLALWKVRKNIFFFFSDSLLALRRMSGTQQGLICICSMNNKLTVHQAEQHYLHHADKVAEIQKD